MDCSCEIDGCCDGDEYEESEEKILTHKNPSVIIQCGECGENISIGNEYEWYRGEYDGEKHVHHTCIDCLSLRDSFFGGWTFKNIWADFEENMDECYWEVPEACLSKTTPLTRSKICAWIEQYWEEEE